jgi:hypothetical protein
LVIPNPPLVEEITITLRYGRDRQKQGSDSRARHGCHSLPATIKQMLGNNTRKVVDRFIGRDIESEIVNVGHVQPPTADVPDGDIERAPI